MNFLITAMFRPAFRRRWLVGLTLALTGAAALLAAGEPGQQRTAASFSPTYIWQDDILVDFPNFGSATADRQQHKVFVTFWYASLVVADAASGSLLGTVDSLHRPDGMALSPNGSRLFVAADVLQNEDGLISVVDTTTLDVVATHVYTNPTSFSYYNDVRAMAAGPDNRLYLAPWGSYNQHPVDVMDTLSGELVVSLPFTDTVTGLAIHDTTLYVAHHDGLAQDELFRYDISGSQPVLQAAAPIGAAGQLAISPDGAVLTMLVGGDIIQLDAQTLTETRVYTAVTDFVAMSLSPDGQTLLAARPIGSFYGQLTLQLFDLASGSVLRTFIDGTDVSRGYAAFSLASGSAALVYDDRIRVVTPADYTAALPILMNDICVAPLTDDFSDPASGWPVIDTGATAFRYLNGEYSLLHREGNRWTAVSRGDRNASDTQLVQIDGRVAAGDGVWGMVFGLNDQWTNFYTFEIWPAAQTWFVFQFNSSTGWQTIASGTSGAIRTVNPNTLALRTLYGDQQLQINGALVYDFWPPKTGRIGISGGSFADDAEFRYDNFVLASANCPLPARQTAVGGPPQTITLPPPAYGD